MSSITPFANEAESLELGDLTIENRLDQVSIYGSVALTKDKAGLQQARELKALIDAVVTALESEKSLPEHIEIRPTDQVDNPFQ